MQLLGKNVIQTIVSMMSTDSKISVKKKKNPENSNWM